MDIKLIQTKLRKFADEREWDQFHSPKNLAAALSVEASELLELFQWCDEAQCYKMLDSPAERQRIEHEVADILLYVLRFADKFDIDLEKVVDEKIALNAKKYPVELCRGNSTKYTHLEKTKKS